MGQGMYPLLTYGGLCVLFDIYYIHCKRVYRKVSKYKKSLTGLHREQKINVKL